MVCPILHSVERIKDRTALTVWETPEPASEVATRRDEPLGEPAVEVAAEGLQQVGAVEEVAEVEGQH